MNRNTAKDKTLTRHSPLHEIVQCLLDECKVLSSNENIYADDIEGTNISIVEVEAVISSLHDMTQRRLKATET